MRAIVVDDELPSLALFRRIVGKYEEIQIVGEFTHPRRALEQMKTLAPDVIFLDIEMPHLNGIELAKQLNKVNDRIQIVFITAYDRYALEAFDVGAIHYLLKPISESALSVTMNRIAKNYYTQKQSVVLGMNRNRIQVFGGLKVYGELENEQMIWPTKKVKELFAYFVSFRDVEFDKWHLCDLLWPDTSPEKAEHSLHSAISRLKQTFKEGGIDALIMRNQGSYQCDFQEFSCDLWEFEDFLRNNPAVHTDNAAQYESRIQLYQGQVFETEDYLWAFEFRGALNQLWLSGMKKLIAYYSDQSAYAQVERYAEEFLKYYPYDEEMSALLMDAYALAGKRTEVMHTYNRLVDALLHDLNMKESEAIRSHYRKTLNKL